MGQSNVYINATMFLCQNIKYFNKVSGLSLPGSSHNVMVDMLFFLHREFKGFLCSLIYYS